MRVVAYGRPERQAGLAASIAGLASLGFDVKVFDGKPAEDFEPEPCDFAIVEGVRGEHGFVYRAHLKPKAPKLLIVEYGYLRRSSSPDDQDGLSWQLSASRLGWVPDYTCGPERFDALGVGIHALREPSEDAPVVVVGDHPGYPGAIDFCWPDVQHWAATALEKIRAVTRRRVFWRPHPRMPLGIQGFDGFSFGEIDWTRQWACVVYNSNTGNEALIKGCPVFTDGWAGYREVSNTDLSKIESPEFQDLTQYFHRLAHAQWFLSEIRQGDPFKEYLAKGVIP